MTSKLHNCVYYIGYATPGRMGECTGFHRIWFGCRCYYSIPEMLASDTGRVSIRVGKEPRQPIFVRILLFVGFQLIILNEWQNAQ